MEKICKLCGKYFEVWGRGLYCGSSRKDKESCSYVRKQQTLKEWGVKNLERRRITNRICYEKHRTEYNRRSRERNSKRYWKLRFELLKKYNFACQYCGRKAPNAELQIDHIFPKSKGGKGNIKNYTIACKECNIGKSDSLL